MALLRMAVGVDASLLDTCLAAGMRGVVLEAFGLGNLTGSTASSLFMLA